MAKQLGITLPLRLGSMGYFESTTDTLTQIKTNLKNLLLTVKGERVFQPTFGWDGHAFLFEAMTDDNIAELQSSVEAAVQEWMPYLKVENVEIIPLQDYNKINMKVTFSLLTNSNITDFVVVRF